MIVREQQSKFASISIDEDKSEAKMESLSLTNSTNRLFPTTNLSTSRTTYLLATLNPLACCMGDVSCCLPCKQLLSPLLAFIVTTADLPNTLDNTMRDEKVCCLPLSELTLVRKLRVDGGNSFSLALFPLVHRSQAQRRADLPDPFSAPLLFNEMRIPKK